MNKNLLLMLSASLLIFVACSDKWKQELPANTPDAFIEKQETSISDNLAILEEDSKNIVATFEIAFGYQQLGEFKKAITYYEKVLEFDPVHYPALNNLADIYEQVEEYALSAKYIKKLYENNEKDSLVLEDAIRILLKNDEPTLAQSALENYARKTKDTATPADLQIISDLFESIQLYKQQNEPTT
ncbi:MAG: tetratricopeptide repeat protein [Patescibacteria group bacterium]